MTYNFLVRVRYILDILDGIHNIRDEFRPHSDQSGIRLRIVRHAYIQHILNKPENGIHSPCIVCIVDDIYGKLLCQPVV